MTWSDEPNSRIRHLAGLAAITLIAAAVRLYGLGSEPLWLDEAVSVFCADHPFLDVSRHDWHTPLYYWLLHFWLLLGDGEAMVRGLSVLFGVATVPIVYALGATLAGRRAGPQVGMIAALLFALAPFQIAYAQEARMYALLTFAATISMWGLAWIVMHGDDVPTEPGVETSRGRRGLIAWAGYAVGSVIALYSHHLAALFVAATTVYMLALATVGAISRTLVRRFALAQLVVVLCWLPLLPRFVEVSLATANAFWIQTVEWGHVVSTVRHVFLAGHVHPPALPADLLLVALAALGLWSWRDDVRPGLLCATLAALPLLVELAVSPLRPLLLARTLVWSAVPFLVLVAAGVGSISQAGLRAAATATLVVIGLAGTAGYHRTNHKEAWDEAAAYVAEHAAAEDLIVFTAGYVSVPFNYYYRRHAGAGATAAQLRTPDAHRLEQAIPEIVERGAAHDRVWMVRSHAWHTDERDLVLGALAGASCSVEHRRFYEVDVYVFDNAERCAGVRGS